MRKYDVLFANGHSVSVLAKDVSCNDGEITLRDDENRIVMITPMSSTIVMQEQ